MIDFTTVVEQEAELPRSCSWADYRGWLVGRLLADGNWDEAWATDLDSDALMPTGDPQRGTLWLGSRLHYLTDVATSRKAVDLQAPGIATIAGELADREPTDLDSGLPQTLWLLKRTAWLMRLAMYESRETQGELAAFLEKLLRHWLDRETNELIDELLTGLDRRLAVAECDVTYESRQTPGFYDSLFMGRLWSSLGYGEMSEDATVIFGLHVSPPKWEYGCIWALNVIRECPDGLRLVLDSHHLGLITVLRHKHPRVGDYLESMVQLTYALSSIESDALVSAPMASEFARHASWLKGSRQWRHPDGET